jgi:hypothetical protein
MDSSTYVECTESSSDDPVVEWERVKAWINSMQGAQAVQAALRTATSKAWCDLLSKCSGLWPVVRHELIAETRQSLGDGGWEGSPFQDW